MTSDQVFPRKDEHVYWFLETIE